MKKVPVWLIGFMGSGKSTFGPKIARELGYRFIDMDSFITTKAGKTIPEIFAEQGEEAFRELEQAAVAELSSMEEIVVATGGGAPCNNNLIEQMNQSGLTLYLRMSPGALAHRLKDAKAERPLLKGKSDEELLAYIKEMLAKRSPSYEKAMLSIDATNVHTSSITSMIKEFLQSGT